MNAAVDTVTFRPAGPLRGTARVPGDKSITQRALLVGAVVLLGTPMRDGMPTDIFPDIRIPVIAVTFQYAGLSPDEMSGRITSNIERFVTTIVNDVEHVESQTYPGVGVIKVFFQPGVDINLAMSQVTAYAQSNLKQMPPGTTPKRFFMASVAPTQ